MLWTVKKLSRGAQEGLIGLVTWRLSPGRRHRAPRGGASQTYAAAQQVP